MENNLVIHRYVYPALKDESPQYCVSIIPASGMIFYLSKGMSESIQKLMKMKDDESIFGYCGGEAISACVEEMEDIYGSDAEEVGEEDDR